MNFVKGGRVTDQYEIINDSISGLRREKMCCSYKIKFTKSFFEYLEHLIYSFST